MENYFAGNLTRIPEATRFRCYGFDADGKLDPGFRSGVWRAGAGGSVRTFLQKSGRILIHGQPASSGPRSSSNLLRLNSDGTQDITFQPQGGPDHPESLRIPLALLPDDKVLTWAWTGDTGRGLFRLRSDGSQDTGFSTKIKSPNPYFDLQAAVQNDGRIVLAGNFTEVNGVRRGGVALLNPDGTLDEGFNPGRGLADLNAIQIRWPKLASATPNVVDPFRKRSDTFTRKRRLRRLHRRTPRPGGIRISRFLEPGIRSAAFTPLRGPKLRSLCGNAALRFGAAAWKELERLRGSAISRRIRVKCYSRLAVVTFERRRG